MKAENKNSGFAAKKWTFPFRLMATSLESVRQTDQEAEEAFRDQCRRQMERPLESRIKYGFCRTYKPVLDDAPWRVFDSTAAYREWCETNLPEYLGFKHAK